MNQLEQIKKIANFDLDTEQRLKALPVEEFLFHLQTMHDEDA